jgi:hypothetical protein
MPSKSDSDDRAARQTRADAIRRARDKRNASLNVPADAGSSKPAESTTPCDDPAAPSDTDGAPNYVEFIDRKMRQPKKP